MRKKWIRKLIAVGGALAVACVAGIWSVHSAYIARGYEAIGGEYLFILMVYGLTYKTIRHSFETGPEG